MKIRMDVDGEVVTATLDDTAATRDFAALLPLSLTLKDYADIERIADLPRKLSTAGAPAGTTPEAGDIRNGRHLAVRGRGRLHDRPRFGH